MKPGGPRRQVACTVLVVGEGDSEVAWLQHLKSLYVARGSGVAVTIKNARGKGAAHVVDVAIRQSRNAAFDVRVVLLDTDTDWTDKTRATARKAKVQVVPADPCLEAWLLAVHAYPVHGKTSAQLKQDFAARFGAAATDPKVFARHFPHAFLEEKRLRLPALAALIGRLLPQQ